MKKARKSAHQKIAYKKKTREKLITLSEELKLSNTIEPQYLSFKDIIKKNFELFPDYWIGFLVVGQPISIDEANPSFSVELLQM